MKKYHIEFTQEAQEDYKRLIYVINEKYKAPLTAKKYTSALKKKSTN